MKKKGLLAVLSLTLVLSGCNSPTQYTPGTADTPPAASQPQSMDRVTRAAGIVDAVAGTNIKDKVEKVDQILNTEGKVDQALEAISNTVGEGAQYPHEGRLSATVISAVDGDTLKVKLNKKTETVRMLLVDTPESQPSKKAPVPQPLGPESSAFTHKLLDGKKIELEFDGDHERDTYNRLLAYVYLDGKSVQEELVKKGFARVAFTFPDAKLLPSLKKLEAEAKKKRIGIFSHDGYVTRTGFNVAAWN